MNRLVRRAESDDGVALMMSLFVIILASTLSIAVAGSILAQVKPSQLSRKLVRTLSAAEAGIDVAHRAIRAAAQNGVDLPCGPFTGAVGAAPAATYRATVQYYNQNPSNRPDGWLGNSSHKLPCPTDPTTTGFKTDGLLGWWAIVTSVGQTPDIPGTRPGAADRTLTAIVAFDGMGTSAIVDPAGGAGGGGGPVVPVAPVGPLGFTTATSGDGWEALFFGDKIYNVFHHYPDQGIRGKLLDCHSKYSGTSCAGYASGGTYASSEAGRAFGTGPDDLFTAFNNNAAVDRATGRTYVAGGRGTNDIGVVCQDFPNARSCGFTKFATTATANVDWLTQMVGGAHIGTRFYFAGPTARIYCFDYSLGSTCSGYPSSGIAGTTYVDDPSGSFRSRAAGWSSLKNFDDRYIFGTFMNSADSRAKDLTCIDTNTNSICPGYPIKNVSNAASLIWNTTLAPLLDQGGGVEGICAGAATDDLDAKYRCFSLSGAPRSPPWTLPPGLVGWMNIDGVQVVDKKVYFAMTAPGSSANPFAASYYCWDFETYNTCFATSSSGQTMKAYTIRQDPFKPTCIWVTGDVGRFEVFHRDTGQIGVCDT